MQIYAGMSEDHIKTARALSDNAVRHHIDAADGSGLWMLKSIENMRTCAMKTEQMPERISILTPSDMADIDYSFFWVSPPCPGGEYAVKGTGCDYTEYVRAGLALSGHNEPVEINQYRWAKVTDPPLGTLCTEWCLVQITHDGCLLMDCGYELDEDQIIEIGPLIIMPANNDG